MLFNTSRVDVAFSALLRTERLSATPVAPWESIDGDPNDTLGGIRADAPSGLISHRSFLLLFDSGNNDEQLACPISVRYLRPGERVWRRAPPPLLQAPSSSQLSSGSQPELTPSHRAVRRPMHELAFMPSM